MTVGLLLLSVMQAPLGQMHAAPQTDLAVASSARPCQRPARGFVPIKAALPALGRTVRVIQVSRTRENAVGGGPLTRRGKWLMAMDPQTRPGSGRGTVILSGHAWPDGTALGNAMTRYLRVGDGLRLLGKRGQGACYRITERTSYPASRVPRRKAFRPRGHEQLVIVTCSGRRTSPGHWTRRTIWYAVPFSDPSPPPPQSSAQPPPDSGSGQDGGSGGLLGGLFGGS
jgi:hypothetical protein